MSQRWTVTATSCVIALSLTAVGCYDMVSNQNNRNYQNSQWAQWNVRDSAQPLPAFSDNQGGYYYLACIKANPSLPAGTFPGNHFTEMMIYSDTPSVDKSAFPAGTTFSSVYLSGTENFAPPLSPCS
jgi:hypothetical protein